MLLKFRFKKMDSIYFAFNLGSKRHKIVDLFTINIKIYLQKHIIL